MTQFKEARTLPQHKQNAIVAWCLAEGLREGEDAGERIFQDPRAKIRVWPTKGTFCDFRDGGNSGGYRVFLDHIGMSEEDFLDTYGDDDFDPPPAVPLKIARKKTPDEFLMMWEATRRESETDGRAKQMLDEFFAARGISGQSVASMYSPVVNGFFSYHGPCLPIVDRNGAVYGMQVRYLNPTDPKNKTQAVAGSTCKGNFIGLPKPLDIGRPLIIVEGLTDTVAMMHHLPDLQVIGAQSGCIVPDLGDFPQPIVLLGDDDKVGRALAAKLTKKHRQTVFRVPADVHDEYGECKDVGDVFKLAAADTAVAVKRIRAALNNAISESAERIAVPETTSDEHAAQTGNDDDVDDADELRRAIHEHLDARFARLVTPVGGLSLYAVTADLVCTAQDTDLRIQEAVVAKAKDLGENLSARRAQEVSKDWQLQGRSLDAEPRAFAFSDQLVPCLRRVPFVPTLGSHPAWDEYFGRLSAAKLVQAFIWGVIEARNMSRQALWIQGEGKDGKSTVFSVLKEFFGEAAAAVDTETFRAENRFALSILDGKRVGMNADCKNPRILMMERVRNVMSGLDPVTIERKNRQPQTKVLGVKLMFGSNDAPEMTDSKADVSRVIHVVVKPTTSDNDPGWRQQLVNELPFMLYTCKLAYEELCPNHGDFPLDDATKALVTGCTREFQEEFHDALQTLFVVTGNPKDVTKCGPIMRQLTGFDQGSRRWKQNKWVDFKKFLGRQGIACRDIGGCPHFVGVRPKEVAPVVNIAVAEPILRAVGNS